MKNLFVVLMAVALALFPTAPAFADGGAPPKVTTQAVSPKNSTTRTVGGFTIMYSNSAAYGTAGSNKYVRHNSARTEKTAGTGSYQAEAHGALIKGSSYSNPTVWDYISHPCAQSIVNNAAAQTCVSPWQLSSTGQKWLVISGHYFDIGINGSQDSSCSGCIDFVYTTP